MTLGIAIRDRIVRDGWSLIEKSLRYQLTEAVEKRVWNRAELWITAQVWARVWGARRGADYDGSGEEGRTL
jgi:hypothetical protein